MRKLVKSLAGSGFHAAPSCLAHSVSVLDFHASGRVWEGAGPGEKVACFLQSLHRNRERLALWWRLDSKRHLCAQGIVPAHLSSLDQEAKSP
jgi:hypothetical protein